MPKLPTTALHVEPSGNEFEAYSLVDPNGEEFSGWQYLASTYDRCDQDGCSLPIEDVDRQLAELFAQAPAMLVLLRKCAGRLYADDLPGNMALVREVRAVVNAIDNAKAGA
jgi:hypothetical protein